MEDGEPSQAVPEVQKKEGDPVLQEINQKYLKIIINIFNLY